MGNAASPYGIRTANGTITSATTTELIAGIASKIIVLKKLFLSYDSALTAVEWQLKEGSTVLLNTQFGVGPDHALYNFDLSLSVGEGLDLLTSVFTGTNPVFSWYAEYEIR